MMVENSKSINFGINLSGHIKGEFGLGESARAQLRSIKAANLDYAINNIEPKEHRCLDTTYSEAELTQENPYSINLLNFNAEVMPDFLENIGSDYLEDKYNIGYWAWELPEFPPEWEWLFQYYNEIWVPSNYCSEALSIVSPVPVIKIMHSIDLSVPSLQREAIGLPKEKFIFLFVFDFHSTVARKNPIAVIEAFKQAFGQTNDQVLLVIKSSNGKRYPEQYNHLKSIAEGYPIQFLDTYLSKEELNALFYNANCYVSLHRSEGFGLTMAEAMSYGKPVIATGYSANTEFMNVGNSFLVKYKLVEVTEDSGSYKKGNIWADPDVEHAACLMHYIFHNYKDAQQVGLRGATEVKSKLSPHIIGQKIKHRLEHIMSDFILKEYVQDNLQLEVEAWKRTAKQLYKELQLS